MSSGIHSETNPINVPLTCDTFFTYYIYQINPCDPALSSLSPCQKIALHVAQVVLTIFTAGILPLVCYFCFNDHHTGVIEVNKQQSDAVSKKKKKRVPPVESPGSSHGGTPSSRGSSSPRVSPPPSGPSPRVSPPPIGPPVGGSPPPEDEEELPPDEVPPPPSKSTSRSATPLSGESSRSTTPSNGPTSPVHPPEDDLPAPPPSGPVDVATVVHHVGLEEIKSSQRLVDTRPSKAGLVALAPTTHIPNQMVLRSLLVDYVGGGEWFSPVEAVQFLTHYIEQYLNIFDGDAGMQAIHALLSDPSFAALPANMSLPNLVDWFFERLDREGYVAFLGGLINSDRNREEPVLFYEFIKEENGSITFRCTNPGEQIDRHPACKTESDKPYHFRTLTFTGATVENLRQSQFMDYVYSFLRPRPQPHSLSREFYQREMDTLHDLFFFRWPGKREVAVTNPGGARRGRCPSLKAITKWQKGKLDTKHHSFVMFWVKLLGFYDYLNNCPNPSSRFIGDALRKLSSHADKMDQQGLFTAESFDAFQQLSRKALEVKSNVSTVEAVRLSEQALSLPEGASVGLETFQKFKLVETQGREEREVVSGRYQYPHTIVGEPIPFGEVAQLEKKGVGLPYQEMSDRLNLLRCLPDCDDFSMDGDTTPFLGALGKMLPLFFYGDRVDDSTHIPDSFFVDLLNAWVMIYLATEQNQTITKQARLELIEGVCLLHKQYSNEFSFDSDRSRNRWKKLGEFAEEKKRDLMGILGDAYRPPGTPWAILDSSFGDSAPRDEILWSPFGYHLNRQYFPKEKPPWPTPSAEELPVAAHFAYRVLTSSDEDLAKTAREIEAFHGANTVGKTIDAFATYLPIPYYDLLLDGLAHLFGYATNYIRVRVKRGYSQTDPLFVRKPVSPRYLSKDTIPKYPVIGSREFLDYKAKSLKGKIPSVTLPAIEQRYKGTDDLNERMILATGLKDEEDAASNPIPFLSKSEQYDMVAFTFSHDETRFAEALIFFRKNWRKLAKTEYQQSFIHFLFGLNSISLAEGSHARKVLNEFIENSYQSLLGSSPMVQSGCALLFHIEMRLLSESDADSIAQFYRRWDLLLEKSQSNPILGRALCEAALAAMSSLECNCPHLMTRDPRFLQMMITTMLRGSQPADFRYTAHSKLTLHYGYSSFRAILSRSDKPVDLIRNSVEVVFPSLRGQAITWNREVGDLKIGELVINLSERIIYSDDDHNRRMIPSRHMRNHRETFEDRDSFLAAYKKEGEKESYSFAWKGDEYQIRVQGSRTELYRRVEGKWAQTLDRRTLKWLDLNHPFGKGAYEFLQLEGCKEIVIEEKSCKKVVAEGSEAEGFYRVHQGELTKELLVRCVPSFLTHTQAYFATCLGRLFTEEEMVVWAESGHVSRIEIPSFGMVFVEKEGELLSENFPDFKLSRNQGGVSFLKNFQGILVLENDRGQIKVMVCCWLLQQQRGDFYSDLSIERQHESRDQKWKEILFIDLETRSTHPQLPATKKNLLVITWLVIFYIDTRQFDRALELLEESQLTSRKPTRAQRQLITDFSQRGTGVGDPHPHAIALCAQLLRWGTNAVPDNALRLYQVNESAMGRFSLPWLPKPHQRNSEWRDKVVPKYYGKDLMRISIDVARRIGQAYQPSAKLSLPKESLTAFSQEYTSQFLNYYAALLSQNREDKKALAPLIYFGVHDTDDMVRSLSLVLYLAWKGGLKSSVEEMLDIFRSEDSTRIQETLKRYCDPYFKANPYIQIEELLSFNGQGDITFVPAEETKEIISPREVPTLSPYTPMPDYPLQGDGTHPLDMVDLETGIITQRQEDHSREIQAIDRLLGWAQDEARKAQDNLVVHSKFDGLRRGFEGLKKEFQEKSAIKQTVRSDEAAIQRFERAIEQRKGALAREEREILALANNWHNKSQLHLEYGRDLRTPLDMDLLLISLGRKDLAVIHNSNPSLSDREKEELMQKTAVYAFNRCELQQLERAFKALKENPNEYFDHARAVRSFDPWARPELLVVEALFDLTLRKQQVEALDAMMPGITSGTLFEAGTGFGKSKVLVPVWLILNSRNSLAFFISPSVLADQQEGYLQQVFRKSLRFFAAVVDFSRATNASVEDLMSIKADLERAQRNRRPVFMRDGAGHNLLVLKIEEMIAQDHIDRDSLKVLVEMRRIVKGSVAYFDEADKVLNDKHEHNYSLGKPSFIEKEWQKREIDLYSYFLRAVEGRYSVEFWKTDLPLPPLTEEIYREEILPRLMADFEVDPQYEAYLLGKLSYEEQARFEKGLTDEKIRWLHDQLQHYLPQTILKNCQEHYSLKDPERDRTAIPLEDARNPRKGNEYSKIDQMLNFTVQANLGIPFSSSYIARFLDSLVRLAEDEMDQEPKELKDTEAAKRFSRLVASMPEQNRPKSLFSLKSFEIDAICSHVNQSYPAKMALIELAVLPKVEFFREKVSSNPHKLVACFSKAVGASGTLSAMQHFPHTFDIVYDEKAMARTILSLVKHGDQPIKMIENSSGREAVLQLAKFHPKASVFIEVGALLRQYSDMGTIAQKCLEAYPAFEGFATFDTEGRPIVWKRGSHRFISKEISGLENRQLFWMFGQKDITGRDEKFASDALAVLTPNRFTTFTQLVQGAGRMRGIHNGQRVVLVLEKEEADYMKKELELREDQEITLLHVIVYCILYEAEHNGLASFRSFSIQLLAMLEEKEIWEKVTDPTVSIDDAVDLLIGAREALVQSTVDKVLERPTVTLEATDSQIAIRPTIARFEEKLKAFEAEDAQEMGERLATLRSRLLFPPKVHTHHAGEGTQIAEVLAEQTAEAEEETFMAAVHETTVEEETDTMAQNDWATALSEKVPLEHRALIIPHALPDLFAHSKLRKFLPLVQNTQLFISENCFVTVEGDSPAAPGWVNGIMKPLNYIVELDDGRLVIIDAQEATQVLRENKRPLWLVNHGLLQGDRPPQKFHELEITAKILGGDLRFSQKQRQILDSLNLDAGLRDTFKEEILQFVYPDMTD